LIIALALDLETIVAFVACATDGIPSFATGVYPVTLPVFGD
jgi:hypothetical protein